MIIAFHTNQICLQGTEIALFDYAHFSEKLLKHKSIIISRENRISEAGGAGKNQPKALQKFRERFPLFLYRDPQEIHAILEKQKVDVFYAIKKGVKDGIESDKVKTVIHAVFKYYEPHGNVYAYVSKWLSELMTGGYAPYVPHMIHLPKVQGDLRSELGIPQDALVFGRYGGTNSFDVEFVHQVVEQFAEDHKDVHFIFMNTDDFFNPTRSIVDKLKAKVLPRRHPRIHFLPGTSSMVRKSQFINSCNAMIHARKRGETFGIAIGEFSVNNVPVITYGGNGDAEFENNHIEILGDKGFVYNNADELLSIFQDFKRNAAKIAKMNWDAYSTEFGPEPVMEKFKNVFLS